MSVAAPSPTAEPVSSAYEYLLTQGVLGVMCLLLIIALVWILKSLLMAKDARVDDQKKYAEALHQINDAVKGLAIEMNRSSSDTANEVLRSNESTRITVGSLEKSNDKLTRSLEALKDEQVRLGAALTARGS